MKKFYTDKQTCPIQEYLNKAVNTGLLKKKKVNKIVYIHANVLKAYVKQTQPTMVYEKII